VRRNVTSRRFGVVFQQPGERREVARELLPRSQSFFTTSTLDNKHIVFSSSMMLVYAAIDHT
jgi:hypothetical protein